MQEFLDQVAEVLEVASVTPADDFRAVPYWGSLMAFALLVLLSGRYHRNVTLESLKAARTVADLATLAGVGA